jgi:hypothetical protein
VDALSFIEFRGRKQLNKGKSSSEIVKNGSSIIEAHSMAESSNASVSSKQEQMAINTAGDRVLQNAQQMHGKVNFLFLFKNFFNCLFHLVKCCEMMLNANFNQLGSR